MIFGGYRTVWLLVMFDLPTETQTNRQYYAKFRKTLLQDGFIMMQYSVYMRYCGSDENAEVHTSRLKKNLPPDGEVRTLKITDKQFGRMEVFHGKRIKIAEKPPEQISFF